MQSTPASDTISEAERIAHRGATPWFYLMFIGVLAMWAVFPFPLLRLAELVFLLLLCRGLVYGVCVMWPRWMSLGVVVSAAIIGIMLPFAR